METIAQVIRNEADKLCQKHGYSKNYDLTISSDQDILISQDGRLVDIIIHAGHPPVIVVSYFFIARTLFIEKKNKALFKERLERALGKIQMMDRTLTNPIPRDRAIILYQDARKWIKTKLEAETSIPDNYFQVEYIVRVTDKVTGMSFTMTGNDPKECESVAKERLSRIILSDESVREFHSIMDAIQKPVTQTVEATSIQIQSKHESNEVREVIEYGKS